MFETERRIDFYDCDPAGIIFYANIFKLAHSAYEALIENGGTDYFNHPRYVLPIIHSESRFKIPLKHGDLVKIELTVTRLEKSSFELSYDFYNTENALSAQVKTVHVAVSKPEFKKTSLPEKLISLLNDHLK